MPPVPPATTTILPPFLAIHQKEQIIYVKNNEQQKMHRHSDNCGT
jgi:hypothetical protein